MERTSMNKSTLIFLIIMLFYTSEAQAKTSTTLLPPNANNLSEQAINRLWNGIEVKNKKEVDQQNKYTTLNSTYLVYPQHKNTDITSFKLKNKALNLSIPLRHKKSGDIFSNEEKKIIKHLSVYSE